ncbi:helix-turn-helix domain-containing protein [Secundilactobacillus oryzae]|nr:helix-turn-helix transcriptional regulator [Secundilactobacillus oryzae]
MRLKSPDYVRNQIALSGYSQNLFARHIGITSGYLSLILNQEVDPSPTIAKKISDGIGENIKDIFFALGGLKSETKEKVQLKGGERNEKAK